MNPETINNINQLVNNYSILSQVTPGQKIGVSQDQLYLALGNNKTYSGAILNVVSRNINYYFYHSSEYEEQVYPFLKSNSVDLQTQLQQFENQLEEINDLEELFNIKTYLEKIKKTIQAAKEKITILAKTFGSNQSVDEQQKLDDENLRIIDEFEQKLTAKIQEVQSSVIQPLYDNAETFKQRENVDVSELNKIQSGEVTVDLIGHKKVTLMVPNDIKKRFGSFRYYFKDEQFKDVYEQEKEINLHELKLFLNMFKPYLLQEINNETLKNSINKNYPKLVEGFLPLSCMDGVSKALERAYSYIAIHSNGLLFPRALDESLPSVYRFELVENQYLKICGFSPLQIKFNSSEIEVDSSQFRTYFGVSCYTLINLENLGTDKPLVEEFWTEGSDFYKTPEELVKNKAPWADIKKDH